MIRWILFDQAGVQTQNIFSRTECYVIKGKKVLAKDLESIFYIPEYRQFSVGTISETELISSFLNKTYIDITIEEFIEIFKNDIRPIEGMDKILNMLSQNYSLATIINEGSEWANYKLDVSGFRKFFAYNFISGDLKIAKPAPEIYTTVLQQLNAKPEECLFIDDQKKNCEAAEKLGINSIVFDNSEQLVTDFVKFSINLENSK